MQKIIFFPKAKYSCQFHFYLKCTLQNQFTLTTMCFSASASFGASAVLAVIGVASIKQVQHKSQVVFACIPVFFSLQQFAEGMAWISFANPFNVVMNMYSTYTFLIFSQVVWPLWIPIAM